MSKLDNFKPILTVTSEGEVIGNYWTYISNFELRKRTELAEGEEDQLAKELRKVLKTSQGKRKKRARAM